MNLLIYYNISFRTTIGRLGAKCNIQLMSCGISKKLQLFVWFVLESRRVELIQ